MQEALELLCRKRRLANPKDYALILNDLNILIYLDRTVASLEGKRELTLVKRSMLPQLGIEPESRSARTTDPNGMHQPVRLLNRTDACVQSVDFQTNV